MSWTDDMIAEMIRQEDARFLAYIQRYRPEALKPMPKETQTKWYCSAPRCKWSGLRGWLFKASGGKCPSCGAPVTRMASGKIKGVNYHA